jgi:DNA-binding NarL/FixJ family response regulator
VKGDYGTRVIIVSVLEDGPLPKRLIEAGASGYIGKACDGAELLRAVRAVAQGGVIWAAASRRTWRCRTWTVRLLRSTC